MKVTEEQLSAYLDGELPSKDMEMVDAALQEDANLQAQLDALMAADAMAQSGFAEMLKDPVPLALADAIRSAQPVEARPNDVMAANINARPKTPLWMGLAAAIALAVGGVGGYFTGFAQAPVQVAEAPAWLLDIADYHRIYSTQTRHLVEVGADEADHIETWLTATLGAEVRVANLSSHNLRFEGARLLVAAGKPVAQLLYTASDGSVIALCLIQSDEPNSGFKARNLGGFDMVSWGGAGANFVLVGDEGRSDLGVIAETAALDV
ncbi:MAG: anti-sigma factor [Pseudomonadota bacterium]